MSYSIIMSKTHTHASGLLRFKLHSLIDFDLSFLSTYHSTMTVNVNPTPKAAKKTKLKWCAKYQDEEADVELIASDGWHFKVHSYRLRLQSVS